MASTVTYPYKTTEFAFTLNNDVIVFKSDTPTNYFDLRLDVKVYDFYTNVEQHITDLDYKIPLFQSKQEFFVDEIIDRLMKDFIIVTEIQENQYLLANVSFLVSEKDKDGVEVNTFNLNNIKFIAGYKPTTFANKIALLTLQNHKKVVLKTSKAFVSVVNNSGSNVDFTIEKNNTVVDTLLIVSSLNVITKSVDFSNYSAEIGDIFIIKYNNYELIYIIDNDGLNDIEVIYRNKFKLKANIIFKGEYAKNAAFKSVNKRYYKNQIENLNKISSTKRQTLKINTGWLFQEQAQELEALIDAENAWVKINENTLIEVTPTSKKLKSFDSKRQLHSFIINFEIKKLTNA